MHGASECIRACISNDWSKRCTLRSDVDRKKSTRLKKKYNVLMHVTCSRWHHHVLWSTLDFFYFTSVCGSAGNSGKDSIWCHFGGCFPYVRVFFHCIRAVVSAFLSTICFYLFRCVSDWLLQINGSRVRFKCWIWLPSIIFMISFFNLKICMWSNIVRLFSFTFSFEQKNIP